MSWDVVIFSSKQKIVSLENLNEELLVPIDLNTILEEYFDNVIIDDSHREIKGDDYSIDYYVSESRLVICCLVSTVKKRFSN